MRPATVSVVPAESSAGTRSTDHGQRSAGWHRRHAGLSLVECMISLAIAATLLTAVAVAFSATTAAIGENDTFFKATHTGRVALNRVLTHVRRGSVDEASTSTSIRLITDSGADVTYTYVPATKKLMFITNGDKSDPDYVLASNVESAAFSFEMGEDHEGLPCIARVAVTMTIQVGKNTVLLSGAAAPRRNLRF